MLDDPAPNVFHLSTPTPLWLWAFPCPKPGCDCRSALVLSSPDSREALLEHGAPVHRAWLARGDYLEAAAQLDRLDFFRVELDTAQSFWSHGDEQHNLMGYPRIARIAARIDGPLLEEMAQLLYGARGEPDPEPQSLQALDRMPSAWKPGNLVAWGQLCTSRRRDVYVIGRQAYQAIECYCPNPECDCEEVTIDFGPASLPHPAHPGEVIAHLSGAVRFKPRGRSQKRLAELWDAYRSRHVQYTQRLAQRYSIVRGIGRRFISPSPVHVPPATVTPISAPSPRATVTSLASKSKVGRNDSCPCGSQRKFKKCCGA